jgi:hypothetical protein
MPESVYRSGVFGRTLSVSGSGELMMKKTSARKTGAGKTAARKTGGRKRAAVAGGGASALIDARIRGLPAWQSRLLARLRALVKEADPQVIEEWKWSTPVWSHDGLICTGEAYKSAVKMTFARGASLEDPARLFNSSLEGNVRRAIDFHENGPLDEQALKALIRAAVALNQSKAASR